MDSATLDAASEAMRQQVRDRLIDVGVRLARVHRWCDEMSYVLSDLTGDDRGDNGTWYDSDGYNCLSDSRSIARGGYNRDGLDREGYNSRGVRPDGTTREAFIYHVSAGYDAWDRDYGLDGYDSHGFNREGRDREGYGYNGFNRDGIDRTGRDMYGYDSAGYDFAGYNRDGYRQGRHFAQWSLDRFIADYVTSLHQSWPLGLSLGDWEEITSHMYQVARDTMTDYVSRLVTSLNEDEERAERADLLRPVMETLFPGIVTDALWVVRTECREFYSCCGWCPDHQEKCGEPDSDQYCSCCGYCRDCETVRD